MHRFVTLLTARRLLRDLEPERQRVSLNHLLQEANTAWHGVKLHQPDWGDASHSLALTAEIRRDRLLMHLILNAYWEPLNFELPSLAPGDPEPWRRWIDTALDSPHDIAPWRAAPAVPPTTYRAEARSVVVLYVPLGASRPNGDPTSGARS